MPTTNPSFHYVWLIWACAFMAPWSALFLGMQAHRGRMLVASACTSSFGLSQFLFVPAYWNPPSLFDLAHRTGLDLESLIFCFAIGGLGAVGYSLLTPVFASTVSQHQHNASSHRWHRIALATPFVLFGVTVFLPWNPIYAGISALFAGALATGMCRPDLWRNMLAGGVLFLTLYLVFLLGLKTVWPGYIEAVWNLADLIQWRPAGLPVEELLFGLGFGMYWSSVYEHVAWRQRSAQHEPPLLRNAR